VLSYTKFSDQPYPNTNFKLLSSFPFEKEEVAAVEERWLHWLGRQNKTNVTFIRAPQVVVEYFTTSHAKLL
jgi:hypothetical protein